MKIELALATYEVVAPHNAQIDRPTDDLNKCFDMAAQDEDIKVVLLGADGPHFSSGHDLKMTKQAVNTALNHMDQQAMMDTSLALHHMCRAHHAEMEASAVRGESLPEKVREPAPAEAT